MDGMDTGEPAHRVQFYDQDTELCGALVSFALPALRSGEGVLLVATPAHNRAVEYQLEQIGLDVAGLRQEGQLRLLDAADTLDSFMIGGVPDAEDFLLVVGGVVAEMEGRFTHVRVFGEMVDLLWKQDNRHGAVELESLWNDLAQAHRFTLLCGYAVDGFSDSASEQAFGLVCALHDHVAMPAEFRWSRESGPSVW